MINVDPAVLAAQAAAESGGTAAMSGAASAAAGPTCAVIPPGADDVSVRACAVLNGRGAATTSILSEFIAMRGMFAGTVGTNGATYTEVEAINAAAALIGEA